MNPMPTGQAVAGRHAALCGMSRRRRPAAPNAPTTGRAA